VQRYYLPSILTEEEKRASASPRVEPTPTPRPDPAPDGTVKAAFAAIDSLIELTESLKPLTGAQYLAVKQAAVEVAPEAATFAFAFVENGDPYMRAKAASTNKPDPTITTDHPAVVSVKKLAAVKTSYPKQAASQVPLGYAPVTDMGVTVDGWYSRLPQDAVFGVPIPQSVLSSAPEPVKSAGIFDRPAAPAPAAEPTPEPATKVAGFGSGFSTIFGGGTKLIGSRPLANEVASSLRIKAPSDPTYGAAESLSDSLGSVDEHAAIQSILADPRFVKADPHTLVQTYRDLSGIAPTAMQNPAIASDFLTRKVQTGPLGYHDLEALSRLEKNFATMKRPPAPDPDDDDDK
jgi:hypothetical protein